MAVILKVWDPPRFSWLCGAEKMWRFRKTREDVWDLVMISWGIMWFTCIILYNHILYIYIHIQIFNTDSIYGAYFSDFQTSRTEWGGDASMIWMHEHQADYQLKNWCKYKTVPEITLWSTNITIENDHFEWVNQL